MVRLLKVMLLFVIVWVFGEVFVVDVVFEGFRLLWLMVCSLVFG